MENCVIGKVRGGSSTGKISDGQYGHDNNGGGSSSRNIPMSSSKLDDQMKRLIE
jgi:hypothetical protein